VRQRIHGGIWSGHDGDGCTSSWRAYGGAGIYRSTGTYRSAGAYRNVGAYRCTGANRYV
jgi:hypothetical protein